MRSADKEDNKKIDKNFVGAIILNPFLEGFCETG